ncbi:hypothetical protein EYF80_021934 [Liparis tanakae]|uniref:Uncharacterized protein n=1 Tax=Liparis tanakae TaxID=230148 RepID=A0A4Z2HQ85_9TELE|nr:hypothetical protein EYF80_021934 [Liparis tanakae]
MRANQLRMTGSEMMAELIKQPGSTLGSQSSFELVGMDLMKLPVTEGGNQYTCVRVGYFTKWAEAYPQSW